MIKIDEMVKLSRSDQQRMDVLQDIIDYAEAHLEGYTEAEIESDESGELRAFEGEIEAAEYVKGLLLKGIDITDADSLQPNEIHIVEDINSLRDSDDGLFTVKGR